MGREASPSGKLTGKRLLVLGSSTGATDIVAYARSEGALVYVADNLPEWQSPAKMVADRTVDISTADVGKLCELVRRDRIDGVASGVSGFNLLRAMEVSEACGLRYHFTRRQWDAVETKDGFRELCGRFSVPCPRTYYTGSDIADISWGDLAYPVVVKPVDNGASRGVFMCASRRELERAAPLSLAASEAGRIIVEERCPGREFTAHYVIRNSRAHLVCMDNRYPVAVHPGDVTTIPIARIYPSLYLQEFQEEADTQLAGLFSSLGLECAVAFVQGLYDEGTGRFSVFEAGMRSAAECPNRILGVVTGNDYMRMLVDHVLLGTTDYDNSRDDPCLGGRCCGVVSLVARHGTVGAIEGLEEAVAATPAVIQYESRYPVGSTIPDTDTLRQLMIRFVMMEPDRDSMARDIAYLNGRVVVLDDAGEDMVIRMDPERVFGTE